MHKKTFSLESGAGLSDPQYQVETFPVEVRDGEVYLRLPTAAELASRTASCPAAGACAAATEAAS
jgi:hypothetical protein